MLDKTKPDNMPSSSTPVSLTRTFSPGPAYLTSSSSQYISITLT